MGQKLYEETNIQDIADAIREQNGTQNSYTVAQMGNAVRAIRTDPVLEPLSVTENGNYLPSANKDGFSEVEVIVPNSYTNSDEGKVVKNGALVAQTARATAITENGTYDTTENDEVTVNVSGGGSEAVIQSLSVTQNGTYNPPSGVDGYSPVVVNVSGGGSGNELLTELAVKTFIAFSQTSGADLDTYIAGFDIYDFDTNASISSGRSNTPAKIQNLTLSDILGLLQNENNIILEYFTNTSNDSTARSMFENLIQNLQAVNLGRISGAGVLTDSINNYSYIMIVSRYNSSGYNAYDVAMIYKPLELGVWYATGMKDRNSSYRAYAKFGENDSVIVKTSKSDSGSNGNAIIYGIP